MGALHLGHQSLAVLARRECEVVVASIFVNPTQFGPAEDLEKYPRTLQHDLQLLEKAGVDCVFAPSDPKEMYRERSPLCHVEPAAFSSILEGIARPDFFRGVATVVTKLFNIIQPSVAYFGQKDISQCILIQRMVRDLDFPIDVRICETLREEDGLAMSSRNTYLTAGERKVASVLFCALSAGKNVFESRIKERNERQAASSSASSSFIKREEVVKACEAVLAAEPLVTHVEYISAASAEDMCEEMDGWEALSSSGFVLSAAIKVGEVRLIDNLLVGSAVDAIFGSTHSPSRVELR